jgi:transcriptional regulator with PAS, ATPase and Fis domain
LGGYLPNPISNLPALIEENNDGSDFSSEREILYKILFDMKKDLNEVKKVINKIQNDDPDYKISDLNDISEKLNDNFDNQALVTINDKSEYQNQSDNFEYAEEIFEEETLSIQDKEIELIIKSLERNNGKRKAAAKELGISERTLYRKIKQYDIKL